MAPRILDKIPQVHRLPYQAKAGLPPGRGALPGTQSQAPFVATDAQRAEVRKLRACGFTVDSVSVVMNIPSATLERHFAWEIEHGKVMVDAKILGGIVDQAIDGDKTMSIFYAKARGGWRERGRDDQSAPSTAFTINISHDSPSTPDTGHQISITALPLQPEEEP